MKKYIFTHEIGPYSYSFQVMQYDTWNTPTQKDIAQSRPISEPTLMLSNLHMKNALLEQKCIFLYFPLPFCYYVCLVCRFFLCQKPT